MMKNIFDKEKAIIIANSLYADAEIYLDRKYENWNSIKNYQNIKLSRHIWTEEETKDALTLSQIEFIEKYPDIGISRLKSKLSRLKKGGDADVDK